MTLICVPRLAIFIILIGFTLFGTTVAQEEKGATEVLAQSNLDSNLDDTSLFRGVENAIDEDSEGDDAYRIFKSLQDVTEEDFAEEEDDPIDHSSSKEIKERIQPEEEDQDDIVEEDPEEINDPEEEQDEEEEEEEEEDDDFSADSFPDFKNEAATEFFEHLPQQISSPEEEEEKEMIEEEIVDNNNNNNNNEEEYDDLVDNSNNNNNNNNNNINNNIPVPVIENNEIPWHKPDTVNNAHVDDSFYQDYNNYSSENQKSNSSFRHWHGLLILVILVIIYKSLSKSKAHHILDSNNSSPWNETDYLPLHNNKSNNSRHYKWEIKTS
ncbi:hypothetical protein INT47_001507 [Mucor saturninus]|uniref:Uncharacterized protein n=1 Tax=Mucor saturninus TaxID=64648 RepID=A0A8H7V2Z1_9FUNG|nr:hypothetical protein INT47_001507 [Mucor saturninus]